MKAVLGDASFEATGTPEWVQDAYRKFLGAVNERNRREVEERIDHLQTELRRLRRVLHKIKYPA